MGLELARPMWLWLLLPALGWVLWRELRYRTGMPSLKRKTALTVRLLVVCLLVTTLAAPTLVMPSAQNIRWVLLDVSDSAKGSLGEMEAVLAQALAQLPEGEEAGVIAFGREAMVETPAATSPLFTGVHTAVRKDASDLDSALLLANALLPAGSAGSMTVFSDGEVQLSPAAAGMLAARGTPVDAYLFTRPDTLDAQLSGLTAPAQAYEGQSVAVEAVIDSSAAADGTLALYQNGQLVETRSVELRKGENRFAFRQTAAMTGVVTYEARLSVAGDSQSLNNSAAAYVRVSGAPNVLLITQDSGVEELFRAAGMKVTPMQPAELLTTAEEYLAYDAVVLNNIDYDSAAEEQWRTLNDAVRKLGVGLCVLGGDQSYALGGYRGTLLEDLLPLRIDVRNKLQMPTLALMIVIDKSGSMAEGQFGTSRIAVAREAAIGALEVLNERDSIGVIGFDDAAKWVVPFQQVTDVQAIRDMIATLRADGGTAYYTALQQTLTVLSDASAAQKHVIFLSDGAPGDTGFDEPVKAMKQAGITLTTVAVGSGADTRLMLHLANMGGGRSYQANEFSNLPKIFAKDTMLASGSYVQNRIFTPVVTESSALTDFEGFPVLSGYLSNTEKDTAVVSMASDREDPLLAWWNVGAGKVLAWTSDAQGAWTEAFLRWEQAPAFFGGMAAAVMPDTDRQGILTAAPEEDELHITYTIDGGDSSRATEALILAPDGSEQRLALTRTGPDTYEGVARADTQGAYAVQVTQKDETGQVLHVQQNGAVKRYAREYDLRGRESGALEGLAAQTGGRMLNDADQLWQVPVKGAGARKSLEASLLMLLLMLFLLDVALRKLSWEAPLLRWLDKRKTAVPLAEDQQPKPPMDKPKVSRQKEKRRRTEESQQAAVQTAGALLNAQKARKGK